MASPSSPAAKRRRIAPPALRALLPHDLSKIDLLSAAQETPSPLQASIAEGLPTWGVDPNASLWTCIDDVFAGDPMPGLLKIKDYLEKWDREACMRVSLGSSYLFDLARDQFTRPEALDSNGIESTEAVAKKRDVVLRYVVAARGRLLDNSSAPSGDLVAAMHLLLNEAGVQHAKNVSLYETLCERVVASVTGSPTKSSASLKPALHSASDDATEIRLCGTTQAVGMWKRNGLFVTGQVHVRRAPHTVIDVKALRRSNSSLLSRHPNSP